MPTIYTAGYSRLREPRRLLVLLDELDALVLDVRLKPWTRFEGWSKKDLEALCGARYHWIEASATTTTPGATSDCTIRRAVWPKSARSWRHAA